MRAAACDCRQHLKEQYCQYSLLVALLLGRVPA